MFKFYKILFIFMVMIGTLISISSNSWMGMWMGLEINLLSIIPLMNSTKNLFSSEASLKYFITQALASTIFLLSIIIVSFKTPPVFTPSTMILILNSSLMMKMGAAPLHFWFPEVTEGLNWWNCLILFTWQKITPMILVMYNTDYSMFFMFIIISCMLISGIIGLNQISIRKILAYSSINHIAWMLSSLFTLETIWFYYFFIYTMISINIILMLKIFNIFYLKQLFMKMNENFIMKFFFSMNFLSLGGLPPFIGFLPKWLTIQSLINSSFFYLTFLMMMFTLMTLFFYMRLIFSSLLIMMNELNYSIKTPQYNFFILFSNFLSISSLIFCTIMFNLS